MNRSSDPARPRPTSRKLATVAAVAAFTIGLSGYFMGLLQTGASAGRIRELATLDQTPLNPSPGAPTAPRYRDLATRTLQPNHGWSSSLTDLAPPPTPVEAHPLSEVELAALISRRDGRRAFNGAPPTVPHPVDQSHAASCLACHGQPTRIGPVNVPQLSHPPYTSCLQCHAPSGGPTSTWATLSPEMSMPVVANTFIGLAAPNAGSRAYAGAPPMLPHPIWMRQNCLSCHGEGGSSVIKTTHSSRQSCLQCHAVDATFEYTPSSRSLLDVIGTLPPPPVAPVP